MKETKAEYLQIEKLHPFEGHPFKVADNEEMDQLVESIRHYQIFVFIITLFECTFKKGSHFGNATNSSLK